MATETKQGLYYAKLTAGGPASVIASPARLVKLVVTTLASTTCTFFDNAAGDGSGNVLFQIPASAAVGTIYALDVPALAGISATIGTSGVVNCIYSKHS